MFQKENSDMEKETNLLKNDSHDRMCCKDDLHVLTLRLQPIWKYII